MGFLDRLLGREPRDAGPGAPYSAMPGGTPGQPAYGTPPVRPGYAPAAQDARTPDQIAIDRYRYLVRTAPPEAVEQAHAEAFAQLTPEQRREVLAELSGAVPPAERATSDAPQDLARMATRAEMRHPGTLERTFSNRGNAGVRGAPGFANAPGFGSMLGSSMLGSIAGVVIGSAVANAMFGPAFGDPSQPVAEDATSAEGDPSGGDPGAETGAGGDGAGDVGFGAGDPSAGGVDGGGIESGGGFDAFGGDFGGFGEF